MRVKIITIHDPDVNYGSTLQSCGSYNFIKELGYDTEIINYKPNYLSPSQSIKKVIPKIIYFKEASSRRKKINKYFQKHAKLTKVYKLKQELEMNPPEADVYITGSDVIWNRDVNPEGADSSFYLGFVNKGVKISYAPSMGEIQTQDNLDYIVEQIRDFKYISVREEQSKEQLINAGLSNVECVLDPVFLMPKEYYEQQVFNNIYGNYTLVYLMSDTPEKRKMVQNITREYGNPVIGFGGLKQKSECNLFLRDVGVEDFLTLIYHAKNIITDSFHCVAFSLIFEKQFLYLPSIDSSMRIENLLSYGNLENYIIRNNSRDLQITGLPEKIDYSIVKPLLEKKIVKSRNYLKNVLYACEKDINVGRNF